MTDPDQLRPHGALGTVEAALRNLRILAAALLFLYYATRTAPMPTVPIPPLALAFALAASLLGVNLLSLAGRRTGGSRAAAALGAAELAADATLVFVVVSVLEVTRKDLIWVALVVPVLEGALRYRMRGAVLTWATLGAAYLVVELYLFRASAASVGAGALLGELQTVIHRLAVVLLVAVPCGYLSEQLLADMKVTRLAGRDALHRSGLLHRVAQAGERVAQLDEQVLEAVLECTSALGFDAAEVRERQPDGTWGLSARQLAGRSRLPAAHDLTAATALALERHATVVVDWRGGTPGERALLTRADLEAVIIVPLLRPAEAAMLICAGLRTAASLEPQVECLELLARQAGTALRNGVLVSELRDLQGRLEHQAFHDPLTSLPNRARFLLALEQSLADPQAEETFILFLDLDRFKPVNDSFGHEVGDELLKAVSGRLLECVREGDIVARFGGDEFVILMHPVGTAAEPDLIAKRVLAALSVPFTPAGHEVVVGISVGIVAADDAGISAAEVLRRADVAMYEAKRLGRGRWQRYLPELDEEARSRTWMEADLRHALDRDELRLVYQPVVRIDAAAIAGFEALLRWDHPEKGPQSPPVFIALAEDNGLIIDIGRWVLTRACAWLRQLQHTDARSFVAVNVSPRQLQHLDFFADLDELITMSGIDPSGLLLEITERIVVVDGCEQLLTRLRQRGVRLALDDFGQGQTSLRYLRRFPLDVLKIDKTIVHNAVADQRDRTILKSIVTLAGDLGLAAVAEGVETAEHLALLQTLDCELAQGFFLHPPMEPPMAEALIAQQRLALPPVTTRSG